MSKHGLKVLSVLVLLVLLLGLGGCGEKTPKEFKIGVVTGTVSQGEDEYRAAERVKAKYGDRIIHVTYPDNFMQEQETTIAQITGLAADKSVKAIVICQAVPGTAAAIDKIRQTRKDVLILVGVPHEDPKIIAEKADLAFETDNLERGRTIVRLAKEMGAKKFLHYSFPRHMSMELLAKRRDIMKEECERLGMEFIFVTAPDPMGPEGIPGAQKFILEDVPRQVAAHGKDIAVFSTNCAMQEPLIKACLETGAIFPEQCCPSPTHGYPGALEIDVSGMAGDMKAILAAIEEKIVAKGGAGRFATWPVPINMVFIETAVELAFKAVEGKVKLSDMEAVKATMKEVAGVDIQMKRYEEGKNMYLVVSGSYIFGKK
ncbi:MAG: DUF3798 domain-containing protein [Firmicutes bacterium]|nr:DUF3798 domain-containing protein [Candidatus Fermentithermobacillaceae bacterium]